ncbi:Hypothetical protein I595_1448 [Croceitalea dokdonensis DOKDO 023]|uniref:LSU ribosomal protein L21p n=1 Tax=Croceitalea dokdonensis DOKDO 023 TaxID=1300341 RepID=A0A0P7AM77_9FLAO|nr:hypothetical protein [Croceitalea dokdonensis]KPM33021.1 Hypothetical protein I595_1448 [Croceitalea dokdonensis DOKDO 023]
MNFDNIWCWLIPLLVGAICGLLGYLWGKGQRKEVDVIDNSAELKALSDKNAKLQADLDACNASLKAKPVAAPSVASPLAAGAAALAFDANAAKAVFGKKIKQDDLKIVEGIGPKIEQLFNAEGINTWLELSNTAVSKCQEILDKGGKRYQVHDPGSWPLQAKMAYKGEWKQLAKWQDEHKGGKL